MVNKKHDCYIASGWFNPEQANDLEQMKKILTKLKANFFSPKDHLICPAVSSPNFRNTVFRGNKEAIEHSDFLVANTRDKDMGTIFECGMAYEMGKPIVYYCEGLKGTFNLMLSQSGCCVATNLKELEFHLSQILKDLTYAEDYKGTVE